MFDSTCVINLSFQRTTLTTSFPDLFCHRNSIDSNIHGLVIFSFPFFFRWSHVIVWHTHTHTAHAFTGRQEKKEWDVKPRSMCVDSPFVDRVMKEPCNRILYILYTHTFRSGPRFVRCVHQTWNTFRVVCALLAKYCRSGRRLPPFQLFSYRFSIQYTIRSFQSSPRFHFDL